MCHLLTKLSAKDGVNACVVAQTGILSQNTNKNLRMLQYEPNLLQKCVTKDGLPGNDA